MEKRYLVYSLFNGRLIAEVQYGDNHTTMEKSLSIPLKRIELLDHNKYPLEVLIKMYPYERT